MAPVILAGDFNSEPGSGVIKLLKRYAESLSLAWVGSLAYTEPGAGRNIRLTGVGEITTMLEKEKTCQTLRWS
jgi:endonuclease/exonuclease/phosphatase family metal-dependent hydrolase